MNVARIPDECINFIIRKLESGPEIKNLTNIAPPLKLLSVSNLLSVH